MTAAPSEERPRDHASAPTRAVRLLAVDGDSLGHRGFHSARRDPGDAAAATTGAVVAMLASAWMHGPYDGVVVGFDSPVNRRKADEPVYKAGRPPAPAGLAVSLGELRENLAACGFLVVQRHGAEADDVMAATVDACELRGWYCDVLSSDRDLTALVGAWSRLLRPLARFSDLVVEDEAAVLATYGVTARQYTDLAALRGDPSDGLTGAVGIGPKTAARLLRDHGSVSALYANLHQLPPRIEAILREARDRVERNLWLMAPIPHLEVDVEEAYRTGVVADRVHAVLAPLGLETTARRFARVLRSPPPPRPPAPQGPDGGAHGERSGQDRGRTTVIRHGVADSGQQDALF